MMATKKILVIAPAWVGDMIMAQSLFKCLKLAHPEATIDVMAPAWTFSVLSCMPEVANAIEMPLKHGELQLTTRYRLAQQLRSKQYDQAIVLPNSFKSALIPWLAGIPKRTGWLGECRYGLLNDYRRLDKKKYPLMVEQYMALAFPSDQALTQPYPYPALQVSQTAQSEVLAKIQPLWQGKPVLALAAGAAFGDSKCWPLEYYAQVANQKMQQGWDVWLFGSPQDKAITDQIMTLTNQGCENIAGRTELSETIALLSLVSGVVSNDSGLMHMAAALQKPLIAIYGSTSPDFTPPLSSHAQILKLNLDCQPCFQRTCPLKHHRCMRGILPIQVLAAISKWGLG